MDTSVNGGYDLWKSETSSRPSSVDLQPSSSLPQLANFPSSLEFETVPSVFSFNTCPSNYRDLSVFKEKGPHDIADALLSLKHPIVHPQFGGPLSPISPSSGMPYFASPHQGFNSGMAPSCTQGLPYPVSHNPSVLHNTYSTVPPQYSQQYETGQLSPTQPPTPNVHFPSMSVNVSMSMNVGVPHGLGNGQYNNLPQQWGNQPQSPTLSQYHNGHTPGLQPQYPGCGPQHHPFQSSYSFTPELRSHVPESRGFYYKSEGLKDVARFCATGHFKKSKFLSERPPPTASFNEGEKIYIFP
ncbi:hypothetical protein SNE40_007996 [Patella caerulea]|uniref:Uncharacterized protein n=1 Tax=Patella caerulea TaxID=87958 RepID=A0AAN8Q9G6_PATCE